MNTQTLDVTKWADLAKLGSNSAMSGLSQMLHQDFKITALSVDQISAIQQRKGVTFLVIAEIISLGDNKLNQKIRNTINKYIESVKAILVEGQKTGVIRSEVDLDAAATVFFNIIQGLVNLWALSQYEFDLITRYETVWPIFLKSIVSSSLPESSPKP